jgi:hypothetical protein
VGARHAHHGGRTAPDQLRSEQAATQHRGGHRPALPIGQRGRTATVALNWLAAIALCLLLAGVGPGLLDNASETYHTSLAHADAIADAQAAARRDAAARHLCGPHAQPRWISATEVACTGNGSRTRIARATTGAKP